MILSVIMNELAIFKKISNYESEFKGVFTLSDLKNLLNPSNNLKFHRQVKSLEKQGVLTRFTRGFYVSASFNLEFLSQRICENSYLSLATILSKNLLIGSVPRQTVFAVKVGRSRSYKSKLGNIFIFGLSEHLYFGFQTVDGINVADSEKAFLDTLYFYQKGFKPYFNIYQDIAIDLLDKKKIKAYLKHYKNDRFVKFVEGVLNGGN